jgi:hypothetical protein
MFKNNFNLIVSIGGVIFTKKDFLMLQKCMQKTGDQFFVIIENQHMQPITTDNNGNKIFYPLLQFKFPISIKWEELLSGGYISIDIFESLAREFFIFGDSGKWGRYIANEYWNRSLDPIGTPLHILGFKHECASIFKKYFSLSKEELDIVQKWLPSEYKDKIL